MVAVTVVAVVVGVGGGGAGEGCVFRASWFGCAAGWGWVMFLGE